MYDATITLFNLRRSDNTWRTTLFEGVNITEPKAATATTQGTRSDDTVEIMLRCDRSQCAAGMQYAPPKAYQALDDPTGYFTLTPEADFIAVGDHTTDETVREDDYDEGLYHAMNDLYDGVYMVTGATWFSLLPHFEIGGR